MSFYLDPCCFNSFQGLAHAIPSVGMPSSSAPSSASFAFTVILLCIQATALLKMTLKPSWQRARNLVALPESDKDKWPFNPDSYLGHRGSKELETVTGATRQAAAPQLTM